MNRESKTQHQYAMIATAAFGLEGLCKRELLALGFSDAKNASVSKGETVQWRALFCDIGRSIPRMLMAGLCRPCAADHSGETLREF